jgi:hypothetical protein
LVAKRTYFSEKGHESDGWVEGALLLCKHNGLLLADLNAFGFPFAQVTNQDPPVLFKDSGLGTFQNAQAALIT